jgi:hypothetical protein
MKHFDITEWADFVLGTLPADKRDAMASHLASECPDCSSVRQLLQRVREVTAADALYSPPVDLVNAVANIPASRIPQKPRLLDRIVATLIYDSMADPQREGARSGHSASRQLALQAGSYHLELQMDRSNAQVTLVGQFACDKSGTDRIDGIPVLLLGNGKVLAQAVTNDFGEFCLEYRQRTKLRLCIPLEHKGAQIEVALSQLESGYA